MIEKFFDNIAKALYDSLGQFHGLDKFLITLALLFVAGSIWLAIYMYKEVKKANEKTITIMERHEQVQAENVKEYKELNKAGLQVLEKVNTTIGETNAIAKDLTRNMEAYNTVMVKLIDKIA